MTRAQHIQWCKERARREYDHYMKQSNLVMAIQEATRSMVSDLRKHPQTADLSLVASTLAVDVHDKHALDRFLDGFQ